MKQPQIIKRIKTTFINKISKNIRIYVIIAMVILIAITAGVDNCLNEIKIYKLLGGTDDITRFKNNFESVRRNLPLFSIIGYYSDKKYDARTFSLIRYTLSPRIIVHNTMHPFVIGNFSSVTNPDEFAKANNLSIFKTVDKNIVLFKKGGK